MASPVLPIEITDLQALVPTVNSVTGPIYIDTADAIIQAKGISTAYTGRVAYLIELYLAAHFATLSGGSGSLIMSKVGNSQDNYADPTAAMLGIANTRWGQDALALDTSGLLTDLATNPIKAQFKVYGRDSCAIPGQYLWPWGER